MKAKETDYNGYLFRSRLEARWAVFFDHMEMVYKYEPRTFDLEEYGWYVPDFWLQDPRENDPECGWFVEIKPTTASKREAEKLTLVCDKTQRHGLLIQGSPFRGQYKIDWIVITYCGDLAKAGLLTDLVPTHFRPEGADDLAKKVRKALRRASTYKFE